jgi:hypothetical protein
MHQPVLLSGVLHCIGAAAAGYQCPINRGLSIANMKSSATNRKIRSAFTQQAPHHGVESVENGDRFANN